MTVLDVNILIYASVMEDANHNRVLTWLNNLFVGYDTIGLPWQTLAGFLRISTDRRLRVNPRTPADVFQNVRDWLEQPRVVIVHPGPHHLDLIEKMIVEGQAIGPLVSDAVLAALAIENGATLASTDRDFSRFPGLKWVNPLD